MAILGPLVFGDSTVLLNQSASKFHVVDGI